MFQRESLVDANEVIVDEKRRIALNTRNLTYLQNQLYQRNYFKSYRPDLNSYDYYIWLQKWKLGECFLNEMSRVFHREVFRTAVHTSETQAFKKAQVSYKFSFIFYNLNV